jgi:hypothetical protein
MHAHQFKLFFWPTSAVDISDSGCGLTAVILADKGTASSPRE